MDLKSRIEPIWRETWLHFVACSCSLQGRGFICGRDHRAIKPGNLTKSDMSQVMMGGKIAMNLVNIKLKVGQMQAKEMSKY